MTQPIIGPKRKPGRPPQSTRDQAAREAYEKFTPEQKQLLADVKTGKDDPVFFAYSLLGLELHDGQKLWLWMSTKTQPDKAFECGIRLEKWKGRAEFDDIISRNPDRLKNVLVPSNRWGKTLVTAVKHLWYNFYKIGVRGSPENKRATRCGTMNLSPHSNQAQAGYEYILDILFSRLTYMVDGISKKNECRISNFYISDNTQKRMIIFKNGSFYKAVPTGEDQASSLAGSPYLFISYDECAQSLHLKNELPAKIMSRLIDFGGPLDLVSTPEVDKPSHQYFSHVAKLGLKGEDGWYTLIGKLSDNIFLGAKERDTMANAIKQIDPAKYRQVVYGEFVTTGKKMFDNLVIERLWDEEKERYPELGHKYLLWADWGFADTGDPTIFYVLDYTPFMVNGKEVKNRYRIVFRESIRGGSPFTVLARFRMLQREWNGAKAGHDSGNMGGIMIRKMLMEMGMADIIDFSASGDKMDMLFCLLVCMTDGRRVELDTEGKVTDTNANFGRLRSYYIAELEEQMGNYQYNPDKGVTDKRIEQDDVMCLGMAVWWLERKYNANTLKSVNFNPLAPRADQVFSEKSAQVLSMHTTTIPEKRIF